MEYSINTSMLLACWLLLAGVLPNSAAAQSATEIQITPEAIKLNLAEEASLDLQIHSATNMYGFELHLQFDPTIIQVIDSDPEETGVQIKHGDLYQVSKGFLVVNQVDNQLGQIVYAFTLLAPSPPMSGDGVLVSFKFQGITAGSSKIKFEKVILASPDGEPLPFEGNVGIVNISAQVASATPGLPTETPISSPSPLPLPTQTTESTQIPAETSINPTPVFQSAPDSTHLPTQTSFFQGAATEDIPTHTIAVSEPPQNLIKVTDQVFPTTSNLPTPTGVVWVGLDPSDPNPAPTQITWMILLAITLIIFLLSGIIILKRTSLSNGRKPAERSDSDN